MAKQKRRDNGQGSIYQDPSGQWWAISPPDIGSGKRARRRAKDKADAKSKLAQMLRDRASGVDLTLKEPTLAAFLDLWLEQEIKSNRTLKTWEFHELNSRLYLKPRLGKVKLSVLTTPLLLRNQNALMHEDNKAAGTADAARRTIRAALNCAVRWGYIASNPAKGLPKPKDDKPRERVTWSAQQARAFLDWLTTWNKQTGGWHALYALFVITIYLGLRRGEGLGLRWFDVDFKRKTIRIAHTIGQGRNGGRAGGTKNEESARVLPMSETVERILLAQRERVGRLPGVTTMYVFPTSTGTAYQPSNVYRNFRDLIKAYNKQPGVAPLPRIRYHDMRHSCATILLEEGVDLKFISAILGHSTINVTADLYAHVTERGARRVVDVMDRAMEG